MQKPRLVASDVDGTLLDPTGAVTERTTAAVRGVLASGTPFVLVSGRPPRWIGSVTLATGLRGYAVCGNGAVLYDIDADKVLRSYPLEPMLLHDVAHELDTVLPDCTLAVERVGESAFALHGEEFLAEPGYRHPWAGDEHALAPRGELLGHPAVKLLVRNWSMTSTEIIEAAEAVLGDAVTMTFSTNAGMIEVSAPGVTKRSGLAEVAGWLGVSAEEVVAFGDMPNDVPMLRWAGHGVAMTGGHPDALAAADEVTAANSQDGVAQVLERWF
ncbi:MAG TPA: HAD family hydrolase [Pseudonocardiaceae bacterium]|nr:HAD family hydrolase [Pseudonocardiaceae bacterium]